MGRSFALGAKHAVIFPSALMFVNHAHTLALMAKPRTAIETIAERVREVRQKRGWSVRKLAEECAANGITSLTQASITNIERGLSSAEGKRGGRTVTADELLALAYILGVRPLDLMVPHDAESMQIVPGVDIHPYVAATWISGNELAAREIWGTLMPQDELPEPTHYWAYHYFDSNYRRLTESRERIRKARVTGDADAQDENVYGWALVNMASILGLADHSGITLPPIPRWLYDDLREAERKGDLLAPEFTGPMGVPRRTDEPVKLPNRIAVIPDDRDEGSGG
jgi:transcriptional regulator with XRE-family HTH domain